MVAYVSGRKSFQQDMNVINTLSHSQCSHSLAKKNSRTCKDPQERFSMILHGPAMSEYNDKRQLLTPHTSIESVLVQFIVKRPSQLEKELFGYKRSTITLYIYLHNGSLHILGTEGRQ